MRTDGDIRHFNNGFFYKTVTLKGSAINCIKHFAISILVLYVPASTILELTKEVHTTGSYLDMKYTKQKGVLMEEMFDEIRA
jgi:hypothetical protein